MSITRHQAKSAAAPWLFFMFHLPAQSASQRVSVWRRLQKYGALTWKNSAYILPHTPQNLEKFQWLTAQIRKYRGDASIVEVARIEGYSRRRVIALFNQARGRDYDNLAQDVRSALRLVVGRDKRRPPGVQARFNRRLGEIVSLDLFRCPGRKQVDTLLKELESRSGGEATPAGGNGMKRAGGYRGRLWMTRPRPEVDRVGSAWLIKHFIDSRARFAFSSNPRAHPSAVRFDMFEGEFTHVGNECTFETLLRRFALRDRRLRLVAQIVHDADLEDNKYGRAGGRALDLILKGWGKMDWSDEQILREGFRLFQGLYVMLGN